MGEYIKDMPEELRPYEKFLRRGPEMLDDAELLAILLRTGTRGTNAVDLARKVLKEAGGTLSGLYGLSYSSLLRIPGVGKVKAVQILSLLKLSERIAKSRQGIPADFSSPSKIAAFYMQEMRALRQEILKVLFLNNKCGLIREKTMSIGTVNSAVIPVREILVEAMQVNAVRMILIHNHPSGDPAPSEEDVRATRMVREAGNIAGISLEDHLIIGDQVYISLREQGYFQ